MIKKRKLIIVSLFIISILFLCSCGNSQDNLNNDKDINNKMTEPVNIAQDINNQLQGEWTLTGAESFSFHNGYVKFYQGQNVISGTYGIDTKKGEVISSLTSIDGKTVNFNLHYKYNNGILKLYNNRNIEMTKQ